MGNEPSSPPDDYQRQLFSTALEELARDVRDGLVAGLVCGHMKIDDDRPQVMRLGTFRDCANIMQAALEEI